jgi:3-hydroxybutyryl-CoA dehydratase
MKKLQIGDKATTKRTFSNADLAEYASLAGMQVSGDQVIVPGPLLGGMFSYLLGTQCPGRGTNYLKQHLEFPTPARAGEELTATVEIIRLRPEKELANLRTVCTNAADQIVCEGEALVLVKDVE